MAVPSGREPTRCLVWFCCTASVRFWQFCCKSLFALVIKISFGCTRDFRVKMWGTSSPEDKLAGDLGNVIEAKSIRARRRVFFSEKKLWPGNFDLSANCRPGNPVPATVAKQYRHGERTKLAIAERQKFSALL